MNAGEASVATEARGVAQAAKDTLAPIERMRVLMADYKQRLRADHPEVYSQDLLNTLFRHAYARIDYVEQELNMSRPTATKYRDTPAAAGFLDKQRISRNNYYMNQQLMALFVDGAA